MRNLRRRTLVGNGLDLKQLYLTDMSGSEPRVFTIPLKGEPFRVGTWESEKDRVKRESKLMRDEAIKARIERQKISAAHKKDGPLIVDGREANEPVNYEEYLRSSKWYELRARVIKERECCEACQSTDKLNVHHGTYEDLGNEKDWQLFLLCNHCHFRLHDKHRNGKRGWARNSLLIFTQMWVKQRAANKIRKAEKRRKRSKKRLRVF